MAVRANRGSKIGAMGPERPAFVCLPRKGKAVFGLNAAGNPGLLLAGRRGRLFEEVGGRLLNGSIRVRRGGTQLSL